MITYPINRTWSQSNETDLVGNVHITKNITFDTLGYLQLSYSPRAAMDESVDTDFNNPAVILRNDDYGYFVQTWEEPFETNLSILFSRPTQITATDHPNGSILSDATWFGGLMPVTESNDVHYYNASSNTWVDTNISLTNNGQHQLVNFISLNALAVVDVNTIKLYASPLTATPTLIVTLTIPSDFEITSACYFNQNLYVATQNVYGGHAHLFVWDGLGTSYSQVYEVDSNTIFSITTHNGAVYMVTGNGSLLATTGGQPQFIDAFPIFYTDQSLSEDQNIDNYKNILKSNGDLLYILLNNSANNSSRLLSQPDGVWCYDQNVGLYHRYSVSNSLVSIQSSSTVDVSTNQITVTSAPITGTEVVFNQVFGLTPLVDGTKYFVIKVDSTKIQLATTLANALAGTPIDLLVSSGSNGYTFFPNVDYGQYFSDRTMALNVIERPVANRIYGTDLLWGAEVTRRDNTGDYGTLGTVSDGVESRGYFITRKYFPQNLTDSYNQISIKFSPFTTELDRIIVKYRIIDDMRQFVNMSSSNWQITWTSATTFTTTQSDWANAVVGNEVEVVKGAAGGLLAHITAISENAGTYTVTIDESFSQYTSGDISKAVFRNWEKIMTISPSDDLDDQGFKTTQIGKSGKFIQLKIELRGVAVRIEDVMIDNQSLLPARK